MLGRVEVIGGLGAWKMPKGWLIVLGILLAIAEVFALLLFILMFLGIPIPIPILLEKLPVQKRKNL
jgi:membrane protein implicated in regulation of membrane protease activity